ncbi:MAG: biopolymer transporter ExbD [Lewinellaceae bacterium]|nr:biopolymer transporter ExbD [Saprospiraceae bacterium]MCB9306416.1 biopolymer transporter ExbD [Lewinellaceae bacterium]MCB9353646.1 biopolymer transporter ExbD [Lewinellaceae bacterium]
MPKHKPKRGAPTIDMTAMTDVAFLLLTFFMLTAKMKPQENVVIDTPSSISETKLPDAGTLTILVGPDGRIFLDMAGSHTRAELIKNMNAQYQMGLNEKEQMLFTTVGSFGVPRSKLKAYLNTLPSERPKFPAPGIPVDTADINSSELANWVHNARLAQFQMKQEGKVKDEYVIVVKADQNTPYPAVQKVINTLVDINVNKFNLITSLEADPNKVNAAKGEGGG